jgi:uncharacterized protein (DUF2249 family)
MIDSLVTLDLREHIQSGRDPFSRIMQTVSQLENGQKLRLVVPFEPVPLYGVMAQRGFDFAATPHDNGDWEVLFTPNDEPAAPGPTVAPPCERSGTTRNVIDVDARGLEPPEPLVKILEALARLPEGAEARAHTDRRPTHLYAQLEERGFIGESTEMNDGSFVTSIRRV